MCDGFLYVGVFVLFEPGVGVVVDVVSEAVGVVFLVGTSGVCGQEEVTFVVAEEGLADGAFRCCRCCHVSGTSN